MYNVLVNIPFEDAHTHDFYVMGSVIQLTEERIAEVQAVDKNFISVLGVVDEVIEVDKPQEEPKKTRTRKKKTD